MRTEFDCHPDEVLEASLKVRGMSEANEGSKEMRRDSSSPRCCFVQQSAGVLRMTEGGGYSE